MDEDCELLFFDTFSHESCEELNLDLVQFPCPVYIFEIRVIPLGARVQADFPGGHRLGATNPSSFQLEFFVNDLSKRNACTFEQLGSLQYKQNVEIQFPVSTKIPTDGLVLRGLYSAVTLAVYGVLTQTSTKERSSPPPPPPPQPVSRSQPQDHRPGDRPSVLDSPVPPDWERHPRPVEVAAEPHQTAIHPHSQAMVEGPRFAEVPPVIHPQAEPHMPYASEMPQPVYPEPPPAIVYPECIPATVPSVPTPAPYQQYDTRYQKTWPPPMDEHYPAQSEGYDPQVYRQPDPGAYQPAVSVPHSVWDTKECHPPEMPRQDRDLYEHNMHSRNKERRDKPWDRDCNVSDYKDDDLSRDRDYKRKERDHRSWERGSSDSDRYRDRMKESSGRDRDKDRDRERGRDIGRDKQRSHDVYSERGSRTTVKRPVTPPTPPSTVHSRAPQTPPDLDKMVGGPRTPKEEEPSESFDERGEMSGSRGNDYYEMLSPERRVGEQAYNLSEGEIQEGDNTEDDDGYEEIVSEEEIMSDGEDRTLDMAEIEYGLGDETWNYMSSFSPYHCELTVCQYFSNPTLSDFERLASKKSHESHTVNEADTPTVNKILEMINSFDNKEHTVKWMEALESLDSTIIAEGILSIDSKETYNDAINTLVDWVVEGLDFDRAVEQPQTAYKVRHMKAGVRLASLLFRTNVDIINKLLAHEVPKLLLQLFEQPYMVLPVKLLILRALDSVAYTEQGLNFLLKKEVEFMPPKNFDCVLAEQLDNQLSVDNNANEITKTGYQKLLDILISKQMTRSIVSISALMEKINLFEVLHKFKEATESLMQNIQTIEQKRPGADDNSSPMEVQESTGQGESDPIEQPPETTNSSALEENIRVIITCLTDITKAYRTACRKLAQPKRHLPSRNLLEFPKSPYDPYPGVLRMFKESSILESVLYLVSSPALIIHTGIVVAIRELLLELLQSHNGKLFLLSMPDTVNGIQKALLQSVDESRDENAEESITSNLGMQIVYRLQTLSYIDSLMAFHSRGGPKKELDDHDAVSALHHMYTMIFSPVGRLAVVDILSSDSNLNALLPFVQMTGEEETDTKLSKSVCAGYVTELLMLVIHYSENVSMLENFSKELFDLSQQESTPKLHDLSPWMTPARKIPNYTFEAIPYLTSVLKSHLEDASSMPPELITAVRILKHICLPQAGETDELKYMYAIAQLYSNDGMSYFVSILQCICDTFLKPSHQSVALVALQGVHVVALIKPIVSLMKSLLGHLISSRTTEFQDLTSVPVLLQVFSLMLMIPTSSFSFHLANMVQSDIVETFLSYTQPSLAPEETEESLSKSLWTQMVQQVLKYTQKSPRSFITGLSILSELLPLPLPLQTREPLSTEEANCAINHRKIWSAHLHSLSGTIQEIITGLTVTSCHPLQQLLRRVCIQLADLAAPTALIVVRAILDAFLDALEIEHKEINENIVTSVSSASSHAQKPCSTSLARILNLIAYLVSHAAFKIPFMHVLQANTKVDEKYADVLPSLLNLLNFSNEKPSHVQSQECIVSILQSLCDPDIGFITLENGASVTEVLASCLPSKEQMLQVCSALIQHVGSNKHQYASILPALRSLVMLTEHDYGFYHIKQCLEQHPEDLRSLFCHLSSSFNKESSDYLSTLSTALEFLRLMVNGYEEGAQTGRSMLLSSSELANLLSSQPSSSRIKHETEQDIKHSRFQPLLQLEKLLSECTNDEDAVESLLDGLSSLLVLLNEGSGKEDKPDSNKDVVEPVLPPWENLASQFTSRTVFLVGEVDEERLNPAYWLSVSVSDDTEQDQEQVTCDLMAISEKYISAEFDLKSTLESLCSSVDSVNEIKKEKGLSTYDRKQKYQPVANSGNSEGNIKRTFIAPMRGRGFSRATTHSSRANDPFRSRPPNTSRPPSMHVDDFVALESHHTGSSNQTQQKRQQDGNRGRGRGFDRNQLFPSVRGGGGRFFSPPGPYGRRDPNARGGDQCGSRGTTRISNSAWGNRTNSNVPKSPTGPGVRTNFNNRPSVSDRCNYNSPFVQLEPRLTSQRNRDPYPDLALPPGAVPISRFSRGVRVAGGLGAPVQGHWQETRNKAQNQRFMSSASQARGSGRRDLNGGRHARSFTR